MSTEPTTTPTPTPGPQAQRDLVVISHSRLFYWWPVWAIGLILGLASLLFGDDLVIVPSGSKPLVDAKVTGEQQGGEAVSFEGREIIYLPEGKKLPERTDPSDPNSFPAQPHLRILNFRGIGPIFAIILLLVIVITNVPLRGLWSFVIIIFIILAAVIFALAGLWGWIFRMLGDLDIRMNASGYLLISIILGIIWAVTTFLFDRRIYMVFTPGEPGNMRVKREIGDAEKVFPLIGMQVERLPGDLFRHWILGLGSGDLIVKTYGAHQQQFEMHNVLFIGHKIRRIEQILAGSQSNPPAV